MQEKLLIELDFYILLEEEGHSEFYPKGVGQNGTNVHSAAPRPYQPLGVNAYECVCVDETDRDSNPKAIPYYPSMCPHVSMCACNTYMETR